MTLVLRIWRCSIFFKSLSMKALTPILMSHYYKDSRTNRALHRQRERETMSWTAERKRKERKEMEGRGKGRRDCAYPGVPVLSWGSAWLPLLCCSLSLRHDCIPLFTHYSSNTQTHSEPLAAASPCYSSSSPSISLPGSLS